MQDIKFEPYGPFTVPTVNGGVDRPRLRSWWKSIDKKHPSLSAAAGWYVFAMKAGKGFTPWYVGMTDRASFSGETCQFQKLWLYEQAIRQYEKGTPVLFLIAKFTHAGKFVKPTAGKGNRKSILFLEEMLIGTCLQRNKELLNQSKTKYLKRLHVPGYLNDKKGARSREAKVLARVLGT